MSAGEQFLIHRWADGCAVFDQASGNTHALDLASWAGFCAVQRGEPVETAIESALRAQWPEKDGGEIAALAQGCHERLAACGLI
ncbi:MAG: hypothetical protein FWF12_09940 [Betaproteobacteria bacterium]|nr:hypothetical protein [Betaproteobacteria bacterium]